MKYLTYIALLFLFSCGNKIYDNKIYILNDTINSSYAISRDIKNYIPNKSDVNELNSLLEMKIRNENEFYSKKKYITLKNAKYYQYSGVIKNENDTIIILSVIYKTNSQKYDFYKNNYIWYNENPFSKKKRKYIVIEYNKTRKNKPKILQVGEEPRIYNAKFEIF
jgi:hypothetical protein